MTDEYIPWYCNMTDDCEFMICVNSFPSPPPYIVHVYMKNTLLTSCNQKLIVNVFITSPLNFTHWYIICWEDLLCIYIKKISISLKKVIYERMPYMV